jgi:hypothetical protein
MLVYTGWDVTESAVWTFWVVNYLFPSGELCDMTVLCHLDSVSSAFGSPLGDVWKDKEEKGRMDDGTQDLSDLWLCQNISLLFFVYHYPLYAGEWLQCTLRNSSVLLNFPVNTNTAFFFLFDVVLGFEPRASCLLGRCSILPILYWVLSR